MITDARLLEPKANRFTDVVADKLRRVRDPHVAPLNDLADQINDGRGEHRAPWFDPTAEGPQQGCFSCWRTRPQGDRDARLRIHLR
jgi:hypothetical protein